MRTPDEVRRGAEGTVLHDFVATNGGHLASLDALLEEPLGLEPRPDNEKRKGLYAYLAWTTGAVRFGSPSP